MTGREDRFVVDGFSYATAGLDALYDPGSARATDAVRDLMDRRRATEAEVESARPLAVGDVLYGYCRGHFGHDGYPDKTVEAIGPDWVVARTDRGVAVAEDIDPRELVEYRDREKYGGDS